MSQSPFLLPVEEYQRAISPIGDWMKQTALYASKMLDKPYEACLAHLQVKMKNKLIPVTNPMVVHFERGENGDREKSQSGLVQYLARTVQEGEILAPTFTTYLHPSVKRSVIVDLLDINVAERKKFKKISQAYEAQGKTELYKYYNQLQDAAKRANNSVSGGFVAEGSVINNKSAHSTLTSITRSISSLSNASNERIIEGNRHYFSPKITLYNLISICSATDHQAVHEAMTTFDLVYPSIQDTMACIRRSTDKYWHDHKAMAEICAFVEKCLPVERASIVYTGDLYHLRKLNDSFMRTMVTDLARRGDATPVEDPINVILKTDEQIVNYAHQVNMTMMKGQGKEYEKLTLEQQYILANTCKNIEQAVEKYRVLLKAFFLTRNSPCTIATIPSMIREAVVLSDTDSTMFSCDNWVDWYFGELDFTDDGFAVSGSIMYMATQSIAHILALFSANMNVEKQRLFTLAMKPEYVFPVFCQTSVAKHYYTAMMVKEGNVYKDIKMEIKGVHMKDSTVPTNIINGAAKEMEDVIRTVMRNDQISLLEKINKTITVEQEILRSLYAGESTYLKRFKIKEAGAYKKGSEESPYQFYTLWQMAFAKHYGNAAPPPYNAVRIPLDLPNRSSVKAWFDQLANAGGKQQEIGAAIASWFQVNGKVTMTSFPIPAEICNMGGVPEELKMIMDAKKIILTLTKSYRNVLESLGYFPKEDFTVSELNNVPLVKKG